MELISFEHVSLVRDHKTLLDDISFSIEAGENWVIFGRNGSGKSLLLQLIEGYLFPSRGSISRFGEKSGESDIRQLRKKTGFLGTSVKALMHEREVVLEAVISGKFATIGIYDSYTEADKEKALGLLTLTGSDQLSDRFFGSLSDGEKERVLIARSLMSDPKLLVLDEPCSNLDIKGRETLLSALNSIKAHNPYLSVIYVTHHIEEITPLFHKALILKNGRLVKTGPVAHLFDSVTISDALDVPLRVFSEYGRFWCVVQN